MKKFLILLMFMLMIPITANAEEKEITIHLFYSKTCQHCEAEMKWLNEEFLPDNNHVKLKTYEVTQDFSNNQYLKKVRELLKDDSAGVPYTVIGNQKIVGYSDSSTPSNIKTIIKYYEKNPYRDIVGEFLGQVEANEDIELEDINVLEDAYNIPIFGEVNPKTFSLGLAAVVIGTVDGFNPCAMWILIFLITMLFGMKNRKRMWILGLTFLTTSSLVYAMFMVSWLSFASMLNKVVYIRYLIGLFAIIFAWVNVMNYLKNRKKEAGCEVVDDKKRKTIMSKVKKITTEKNFWIALVGVVLLAVSVNVIELMCSLGLPVLFTQMLSMNDLSGTQYFTYILIYMLFFMLDDLIIFFIAMKTMKLKGFSNKYAKYSHLIGGIIMLLIGILMLFKPEWLMFNF